MEMGDDLLIAMWLKVVQIYMWFTAKKAIKGTAGQINIIYTNINTHKNEHTFIVELIMPKKSDVVKQNAEHIERNTSCRVQTSQASLMTPWPFRWTLWRSGDFEEYL